MKVNIFTVTENTYLVKHNIGVLIMCLCGFNTGMEDLYLTNFSLKPQDFEKVAWCDFHS